MPDNLLKEQDSIEVNSEGIVDFFQEGFRQLNVTEVQLKDIGSLIHNLSNTHLNGLNNKKFPEKGVSNDYHRHIQGAIFAFGSEKYNQEWKEHAASSIREMLSIFVISENVFKEAYEKYYTGVAVDEKALIIFSKIKPYYQYFTHIAHHQIDKSVYSYRVLEDEDANQEDCLDYNSFKKVFHHFFVDMIKILDNYESN